MEAFFVPAGVVALAEIGDKTQLLALLLAARFRAPVPLLLGILVATLANHALAGAFGGWLATLAGADGLRWALCAAFLAMAAWTLKPDAAADEPRAPRGGVFLTTVVAFFVVEMGDKTQVATVALAAQFAALPVVAGTTVGMLAANAPAVLVGERLAGRLPLKPIRIAAAALFAALGLYALVAG